MGIVCEKAMILGCHKREMLFIDDIHLVTKIKKNMKNSLMNLYDKLMLRKRSVIETVNDELNLLHKVYVELTSSLKN